MPSYVLAYYMKHVAFDTMIPKYTQFSLHTGKYPHLIVSGGAPPVEDSPENETVLNFGHVAVGKNVEKWIELKNLSPVSGSF